MTGGDAGPTPTAGVWSCQTFLSVKLRTYTSRGGLPDCSRETTGIAPYSPTKGSRVGAPSAATAILQRLPRAENRISLLSGIHAGPVAFNVALVRRLGSPAAVTSFWSGSQYSSAPAPLGFRWKTRARPSGETIGLESPKIGGCGCVSCFFSPVSNEIENSADGFPSPCESVTIRQSLRGHQPRNAGDTGVTHRTWTSATLRCGPPSGGINRTSACPAAKTRLCDDCPWRKAIQRPSGDHTGFCSLPESVVSRNGSPTGEPDP